MSYNVIPTPDFKRLFKKLSKKHLSLKADLQRLVETLVENPTTGTNLGHNLYKTRLAITSKGKGKSVGARVITFLVTRNLEVYLVHIYDKSQLDNLTKAQVIEMLKKAGLI